MTPWDIQTWPILSNAGQTVTLTLIIAAYFDFYNSICKAKIQTLNFLKIHANIFPKSLSCSGASGLGFFVTDEGSNSFAQHLPTLPWIHMRQAIGVWLQNAALIFSESSWWMIYDLQGLPFSNCSLIRPLNGMIKCSPAAFRPAVLTVNLRLVCQSHSERRRIFNQAGISLHAAFIPITLILLSEITHTHSRFSVAKGPLFPHE